jgi:hypothetical protein
VGKENKLGLIVVRQICKDETRGVYIQEYSSHSTGSNIVSPDYPLFNSLSRVRKEIAKRFKLVGMLHELDDKKRFESGVKEALNEAKKTRYRTHYHLH